MINVLIVDDTVAYRKILSQVVEGLPDARVAATAPTGELALAKLVKGEFNLVLLDVEMPGMGGIEALKRIRQDFPGTEVVMVSSASEESSSTTIKALNLGALEFIRKPAGSTSEENRRLLIRELRPIFRLVATRKILQSADQTRPAVPAEKRVLGAATRQKPSSTTSALGSLKKMGPFDLLLIGISTGGPNALTALIPALPKDFPLPVLLVQHMPALFTAALAKDLNKKSHLQVREAAAGDPVCSGQVLIAPGSQHMLVKKARDGWTVELSDAPPENSCRPAVDVLFRSVAENMRQSRVLALIMTGMGADGLNGVQALKRNTCYCLTQAEASCVVYGMPQAIDAAGLSDESIELADLPQRLVRLARKEGDR